MDEVIPNLRHLRLLAEAARLRSVSAAASAVHLSQPAATQALAGLEALLGAPLFLRRPEGLAMTAEGAAFVPRAERALEHLREGARAAAKAAGREGGAGLDRNLTTAKLRALVAIADSGSFTLAARDLGLSQPSVHRAARALEALAGTPLFRAAPAGVDLTPPAQALALRAKLAFAEIRQGIDEIAAAQDREKGRFVLGSLPLARTHIVPKAVHAMIQTTPGYRIRVVDGRYDELLRSLREGDIDCLIGAMRGAAVAADVAEEPLFTDPLAVVAGAGHPLAGRAQVTLAEAMDYPWVAPPPSTPAGQYLREVLGIGREGGPPVRVESSSLIVLRGLLTAGDYLTVISRHQISHEEDLGLLVTLPVPLPGSTRRIGLTTRRDWRPTPTQARFIDLLRQTARAQAGQVAA